MSTTYFQNVMSNKRIAISSAISLFGLFLNLIGLCICQGQVGALVGSNPLGIYWFYIVFYVLTILTIVGSYATESTSQYKLVLMSLLSICISYAPSNIDFFVYAGKSGGLAVAGLIFFILPLVIIILRTC